MQLRPTTWQGRTGRASPGRTAASVLRRSSLLLLAIVALGLEGCRSDPCGGGVFAPVSGTGGLLSRCNLFKGCRNPFRRDIVVSGDACSDPSLGVPIEAAPIITTPTMVSPGPPVELEPVVPVAPAGELTPVNPTTGQANPAQKTLYETYKPSGGTPLSRREAAPLTATSGSLTAPLAALPPIDAPVAATTEPTTPPVAPPAESISPAASAGPAEPGGTQPVVELPPQPASSGPVSVTEGISRFRVLDPQLAGGSLPSEAGWKFLAQEKGYKTVIDLRTRSEVQAGDDAFAHNLGLRYILMPLAPGDLNEEFLDRFEKEIALAGARPIYLFDADGSRPAVLWYLHQVISDKRDEASAARDAEELGPIEKSYWLAASALIEKKKAALIAPAIQPIPTTAEPVVPVQPEVNPPAGEPASAPEASQVSPAPENAAGGAPTIEIPGALDLDQVETTAWQPLAAMAATGLGMRLAYVSQRVVRAHWPRRYLASLPAPERQARSLPRESGV